MNNNILGRLYIYNESNKIIDEHFAFSSIEELINEYQLDNQINNIFIINNGDSYYSYYDKVIAINLKNEKELLNSLLHVLKKKIDKKSYISLVNLLILESIYHEIEHAKQYKIVDSNINNMEAKLLNLSFNHYIDENVDEDKVNKYLFDLEKEYNNQLDYYYCSPDERFAYIKSINMIYKYSKVVQNNRVVIGYLNYHRLEHIVEEYDVKRNKIICPLEKFFNIRIEVANENKVELIPFDELIDINEEKNNFKTAKRLLYGMPVNRNELDFYQKCLKKTKAYKLFN